MKYWPYEETKFSLKDNEQGVFTVSSPWLISEIQIPPGTTNFYALKDFLREPHFNDTLATALGALRQLPFLYQLPRALPFGCDEHITKLELDVSSPQTLAKELCLPNLTVFGDEWTWDGDAALVMATVREEGVYDPLSLLTVARRFHYLDCSDNKMNDLYNNVLMIPDEHAKKNALATIVRQNHYVTEQCEASLIPALNIAHSAQNDFKNFMAAERGHDKLLARSLQALGKLPHQCETTSAVQALMALLKAAATHNFVALSLSLDFFERPQFKDNDTLADVLTSASLKDAAKNLQIHKDINDSGGHECVSHHFLSFSKPLDRTYALQALRIAELVSWAIARVPYELEERVSVLASRTESLSANGAEEKIEFGD